MCREIWIVYWALLQLDVLIRSFKVVCSVAGGAFDSPDQLLRRQCAASQLILHAAGWITNREFFGNSFALDNASAGELLVVVLLERCSPIVQFCHSVAIKCICLCNWPSVKSEKKKKTFKWKKKRRFICERPCIESAKVASGRDWWNFLLSTESMQRLSFWGRSVPAGATLPEAFFSSVPAWVFLQRLPRRPLLCWLP